MRRWMERSKIAFDWAIDSLRICLTSLSPLRLWLRGTAGGVCVGSNLISHYSGGSSRGIAHNKVSDACSVLSIVAAQCLAGRRRPGPKPSSGDAICREFYVLQEKTCSEHSGTRAFAHKPMANIDGRACCESAQSCIPETSHIMKQVLPTICATLPEDTQSWSSFGTLGHLLFVCLFLAIGC